MCFSATASFLTAAVAGSCGLAAIARTQKRPEVPLAAMPLFFGLQQATEGVLWLILPTAPAPAATADLIQVFLMFALVVWPVYAPMAALLLEPDARRRSLITACLLAGIITSSYFLWSLYTVPRTAVIAAGHIIYSSDPDLPFLIRVLYPIATCVGLMASSLAVVRWLGVIVTIGSLVAFFAYWDAFTSVWCFFAAAASGFLLLHFERARRRRSHEAPAG